MTDNTAETRAVIAPLLLEHLSRLSRQLSSLELPDELTPQRLSSLSAIDRRGPISITELAAKELVAQASMSRMIKALVADDLVKRTTNKSDRRGVLLSTTPKGRRAYRRAYQQTLRRFAEALQSFSDEEVAAMGTLATVLAQFTLIEGQ